MISKVGYLSVDAVANHAGLDDFNPCGYAFVVEDGAYRFVSTDILKLEKKELPVVLNWAVGKKTCQEAKKDINECKEFNNCVDEATCVNLPGSYYCTCPKGYEGDGKNDGTKCSPKPKQIKSPS